MGHRERCSNCLFGVQQSCHRHAPRESQDARPQWPAIADMWVHWCGDYRPSDRAMYITPPNPNAYGGTDK